MPSPNAPATPAADPLPDRLMLGLSCLGWCVAALLVALAWGPGYGWMQAHAQASGAAPGAILLSAPIVALKEHPATAGAPARTQLWVDHPQRGVVLLNAEGPKRPAWTEGASVALRQAPKHPQVIALDLPGAKAFTALAVWCEDMLGQPWAWLPPAVAGFGALASVLAILLAWLRPALSLWPSVKAVLGLILVGSSLPAGLMAWTLISIAKPEVRLGPAEVVQVAPGPKPREDNRVFVLAPASWGALGGKQPVPVGATLAQRLGPQHRLSVAPDLKRQRLIHEGFMAGYAEEAPFVASLERGLWATLAMMLLQGLLWLASAGQAWRRRFGAAA